MSVACSFLDQSFGRHVCAVLNIAISSDLESRVHRERTAVTDPQSDAKNTQYSQQTTVVNGIPYGLAVYLLPFLETRVSFTTETQCVQACLCARVIRGSPAHFILATRMYL